MSLRHQTGRVFVLVLLAITVGWVSNCRKIQTPVLSMWDFTETDAAELGKRFEEGILGRRFDREGGGWYLTVDDDLGVVLEHAGVRGFLYLRSPFLPSYKLRFGARMNFRASTGSDFAGLVWTASNWDRYAVVFAEKPPTGMLLRFPFAERRGAREILARFPADVHWSSGEYVDVEILIDGIHLVVLVEGIEIWASEYHAGWLNSHAGLVAWDEVEVLVHSIWYQI